MHIQWKNLLNDAGYIASEKWCYISEEVWYRLPEKARSRYTEERTN